MGRNKWVAALGLRLFLFFICLLFLSLLKWGWFRSQLPKPSQVIGSRPAEDFFSRSNLHQLASERTVQGDPLERHSRFLIIEKNNGQSPQTQNKKRYRGKETPRLFVGDEARSAAKQEKPSPAAAADALRTGSQQLAGRKMAAEMKQAADKKKTHSGKKTGLFIGRAIGGAMRPAAKQHKPPPTAAAGNALKTGSQQPAADKKKTGIKMKHQGGERKIVMVVGPHKTGSSSMEAALMEWSETGKLVNWAWPAPPRDQLRAALLQNPSIPFHHGCKAFANLPMTLKTRQTSAPFYTAVIKIYQDAFQKAWASGRNMVFASEEFDVLLAYNDVLDSTLRILPDCRSNSCRISAVVVYRKPRIDHLLSLFHEVGGNRSFSEFIGQALHRFECVLNPLGIAQVLAERNVTTFIVNSAAVSDWGGDISEVVACSVLEVPCIGGHPSFLTAPPARLNVRTAAIDLNQDQLTRIGHLLEEFDCGYFGLLANPKVSFLYQQDALQQCSSQKKTQLTFQEIVMKIRVLATKY